MVEMFGVDVGYDGYIGGQFQEGVVGFICFYYYLLVVVYVGIGVVSVDDVVVDDGWIEVVGIQQCGDK